WEKGQLVPALVSERITCDSIVAQYRDELEGAELRPAHRMRFPFAFGMRYGEPTLLREINIAIEIIKQTGILKEFILGYSDQFAGRVLVDGNFPEPMTLDALRESTSAK
ncbi:MAG TPA: hypothetical protein PK402_14735, partial [Tepidisphaeraceae bacterium]|nr:hypothetical protein [Tepidisphaeraceae bacterium]